MRRPILVFPLLVLASVALSAEPVNSQLWGENGEKWTPESRLPDFSFAGYHCGESGIPTPSVVVNVRDFGAKGDGAQDDTQAFIRAIKAAEKGAVLVPAGRYLITDMVEIRKPNIVLRGEGPGKSVLFFPKSLEQVKSLREATTSGLPTSGYSWSGGFLKVQGKNSGAQLGNVKMSAKRGSNVIELAKAATVQPGQRIEISQEDPGDRSLLNYLYAQQSDSISKIGKTAIDFVARVTRVDGAKLTLDRPLRTDVRPEWKTRVRIYAPSVTEVGIENLTFEFPETPYMGHFTEQGFNPLTFTGDVSDCWARDLTIINADSGPFIQGCFNTVENIVFESKRKPDKAGNTGHHGFSFDGDDNLLRNFDIRTRFIHDISVSHCGGNVASQGKAVDLAFDHHRRYPHANLFTSIDIGAGTRMYNSGGGDSLGKHSAAWTTFWNIRAARPQSWPPSKFGPDLMNLVGVISQDPPQLGSNGRWFEPVPPTQLQPANLYEAQLAKRRVRPAP